MYYLILKKGRRLCTSVGGSIVERAGGREGGREGGRKERRRVDGVCMSLRVSQGWGRKR